MNQTRGRLDRRLAAICIAALMFLVGAPVLAYRQSEFDSKRREAASQNPEDISFTIWLEGDKKQFRQGEVIRLEMRFASSRAKTYRLDAATYDRGGRLKMDTFHLEPNTGFMDPLRDHLSFWGGGLRGIPELEEKPYLITYEINEWFWFEQPGKYQLYLTSPRVSRIGKSDESGGITLTSNAVEFEIVKAEAAWQKKELARIVSELDAKAPKTDRRSVCRALRFLGSKAAVPELARRYDNTDTDCAFEYYAGLISSPHRDFVIETLESQLTSPSQPVSGSWLGLLVQLALTAQLRRPATDQEALWSEYWQRRRELYEPIQAKYAARLAQSLHLKTNKAKAVSITTLLDLKWDQTKLPDITSFFNDLPRQEQRSLLEHRWKQVASDSLLPILRQLYRREPAGSSDEGREIRELSTSALKRIYERSPEEGRRLILAEMQKSIPRVGLEALTVLPDETLPELDQNFIENFETGERMEVHSALIERYGSPALYTRIRAILDARVGKMACYEQSRLLAYCLRVEPAATLDLLRQAVSARAKEDTHCYPNVLGSVAELRASPELEKLALEFIDDPDLEVAISAVAVLGKYASAEAEEPLWRRLAKWHAEWNGREQELKKDFRVDDPIHLQTGLQQTLRVALSQSPAWLADGKKLERLKRLCVTRNEREQVDQLLRDWGREITIGFSPAEQEWGSANVAQYHLQSLAALKQKLSQFPKGTVFRWQPFNEGHLEEEKAKLFRELESFLEKSGFKLVK